MDKLTAIKRNDVELKLNWKEKQKGETKGEQYPSVDMIVYSPGEKEDELGDIDVDKTKELLTNTVIPFLGWDWVAKSLQQKFNLMAQNAMSAAEEKDEQGEGTGVINQDRLKKFLEELSAKTESIPELEDKFKELGGELAKLFNEMASSSPDKIPQLQQRGLRISQEMSRINNNIENRKRGPRGAKKEGDTNAATPAPVTA